MTECADMRFSYCAAFIVNLFDPRFSSIDVDRAVKFIKTCQSTDSTFGQDRRFPFRLHFYGTLDLIQIWSFFPKFSKDLVFLWEGFMLKNENNQ